jgi:hypothetical protein
MQKSAVKTTVSASLNFQLVLIDVVMKASTGTRIDHELRRPPAKRENA